MTYQKLQDGLMYDDTRKRIILVGREMWRYDSPLRGSCYGNIQDHRRKKDDESDNSRRTKKKAKLHHTRSSKRGAGKGKAVAGNSEADGK